MTWFRKGTISHFAELGDCQLPSFGGVTHSNLVERGQ